jgi:hypothetical protein
VYFDAGNLLGSDWSNDRYVMDRNLYFDIRVGANPSKMKFGKATFSEWKARGHDEHSLIDDPLFAEAAKFDFRLKSGSPALNMGFRQIDLSAVGVRSLDAR